MVDKSTIVELMQRHLTRKQYNAVKFIDNMLYRNGYACRLVGGCVRDMLVEIDCKDVDVATDAPPEVVTKIFQGLYYVDSFVRVVPTGLSHGTVTLVLREEPIEVTTLRIDVETDGRKAEVEFTSSWELDAARRDFTFNAMSVSFDGSLYDYFDGVEDLRGRKIRFVGEPEDRIHEDYLRILRFFRFYSRFSYDVPIERNVEEAIRENAVGLNLVSGERIWSELTRAFSGVGAEATVRKMRELDVLKYVGIDSEPAGALLNSKSALYTLTWLLRSHDALVKFAKRVKLDRNSHETVYFLIDVVYDRKSKVDLAFVKAEFSRGVGRDRLKHLCNFVGLVEGTTWLNDEAQDFKFPVSGADVLNMGIPKGPEVGKLLNELREAWIASNFSSSREELLDRVKERNE